MPQDGWDFPSQMTGRSHGGGSHVCGQGQGDPLSPHHVQLYTSAWDRLKRLSGEASFIKLTNGSRSLETVKPFKGLSPASMGS